jgi:hypothetical protein
VRLQAAQPALVEALGGEQEVDAERPADATDLDEHVDEVGTGGEQLAELVTDDQKAGQRGERHTGRAGAFVVALGRVVSGLAQQLLPAGQFTGDRAQHAVDERQLVAEVGDDRAGVR